MRQEFEKGRDTIQMETAWQVVLPFSKEWTSALHNFEHSAFRLELLQEYNEPSEAEDFARFKQGETIPADNMKSWCDMITRNIEAGKTMSRVHVVDLPLSDYLKFEITTGYVYSLEAGEKISLIDRSLLSDKILSLLKEDFWLFDDSMVMVQDYTEERTFLRARISRDSKIVDRYKSVRDLLLEQGIPLRLFYLEATGQPLN